MLFKPGFGSGGEPGEGSGQRIFRSQVMTRWKEALKKELEDGEPDW